MPDLNDFHNFKQYSSGGNTPPRSGCLCMIATFTMVLVAVGILIGILAL